MHSGGRGRGCRVPRNERQRRFPDEGCGSSGCLVLFAEAGRRARVPCRERTEPTARGCRAPRLGRGGGGSQVETELVGLDAKRSCSCYEEKESCHVEETEMASSPVMP